MVESHPELLNGGKVAPKVFIISMFDAEANVWLSNRDHLKFERKISVAGLSPIYPQVCCSADGDVCHMTTGESLINAALSIAALTSSPLFDLRKTYFFVAGIAGINPKAGTLGSVTFAKYAVQVDLQYEFDAREIPASWITGYVPQGAPSPDSYPEIIYGTEVFEINDRLRKLVMSFTSGVSLDDSAAAVAYRALFADAPNNVFQAATMKPSIIEGDVASSNVFFHGHLLSEGFEKSYRLFTQGQGSYCTTAQEDTAILGALLRAALCNRVDFSRIIIMRAASNFDRPFSSTAVPTIPLHTNHGGFEPALENIYRVGIRVVLGILKEWVETFESGVQPNNYIGDILGSLGGVPSFGPGRQVLP